MYSTGIILIFQQGVVHVCNYDLYASMLLLCEPSEFEIGLLMLFCCIYELIISCYYYNNIMMIVSVIAEKRNTQYSI